MVVFADNYQALVNRGASRDNTQFEVWKCQQCGAYALYENERSMIYLNSEDLSKGLLYGLDVELDAVKCLTCSAVDSFEEAPNDDKNNVRESAWGFALLE